MGTFFLILLAIAGVFALSLILEASLQ